MISDLDIYRAGNLLRKRHGDEAVIHAAMRADELLDAGDLDCAAMWRRILLVPFEHTVPDDKVVRDLKPQLKTEPAVKSAILAWAVKGCLDWQKHGDLGVPPQVTDATAEYRRDCDPLADFAV